MNAIKHHIGIDCGKATGLAVYSTELKRLILLDTTDFFECIRLICDNFEPDSALIWVEDPGKNKPVFAKPGVKNQRAAMKVAQSVGGVKRESELMIQGLERQGYEVKAIRPDSAKWSAETFVRITGWAARSSQHARDAAKLVYGR